MLVPAAPTSARPRSQRVSGLLLAAAGAFALLAVGSWPSSSDDLSAAFVSASLRPAVGRDSAPTTLKAFLPFDIVKYGKKKGIRKLPWVEPTAPQEFVEMAAEDGFRLRPKYNHMKIGYVTSDVNIKTRVALIEYYLFDAKYGSWYKRTSKIHFHDEYEISKIGDVVLVAPCRKQSNMKAHRLVEVMKKNNAPTRI
ncbi:unnamed protein product [Polarella glacialis]|uniref:30S ribosomal protein S17, chloroplastic n=1 Tax=Polarella glacialis TaxID=89957 RepID=A0A813IYB2_POLGL|nr:unnamed protein product [Polarella glacialis]